MRRPRRAGLGVLFPRRAPNLGNVRRRTCLHLIPLPGTGDVLLAPTMISHPLAYVAPNPRQSLRLSRLLHPHSAALTYSIGTTTSSSTPRTKPRPTRRHQRGCTLIASHLLLNSTSRHRRCSILHPHGAATLKPAPRATSPWRLSPSARPLRRRRPYQPDLLLLLRLSLALLVLLRLSLDRSLAQLLLLLSP